MPRLPRQLLVAFAGLALACATPSPSETPTPPPTETTTSTTTETAAMTPALALLPALADYVASLPAEFDQIPAERKQTLEQIAEFVRREHAAGHSAKLVFICTHNSRRSHMSQIWAATAAAYHGLERVETYSGGTEATAFNPRAVAALARAGFDIPAPAQADNPHYQLAYASGHASFEAFSKVYAAPSNPQAEFAAIMNCSEADEACPFVPGATFRISLAYDDPKIADGTPAEQARYDERCRQIAREMFYLFAQLRG